MAYSYVEYVGTVGGTTGPFAYGSVALLDADTESISTQLKVYKNGTLLTITTDYTIDTINEEVDTVDTVYDTDVIRIARETKGDARYVDYVDSTNVTAELLDLDSNQLFYLVQEAVDLQGDAMIRGTDGQWNGRGYRVGNLASGVYGTDAVTVNQLNAAVTGSLPASLAGYGVLVTPGDGSTTNFPLPDAIVDIAGAEDVAVYINGLRQEPGTDYTLSSGNVVISPAPSASDSVMLAHPEGAVTAILTTNSVTTTSIQDDAVTPAKIDNGSNGEVLATVAGEADWVVLDSSYISDFDATVQANRLDEMAAPTASVSLNSQKITNLAAPSTGSDAANKTYVDAIRDLTANTSAPSLSGSTTTASFTTSAGFLAGQFTIMVPIVQSGSNSYFSCSGALTSSYTTNPSSPIRVFVPDTDANVGAYFTVYYTRTTVGSGCTMAFTVTRVAQQGTASNIDIDTSRTALVALTRGTN